MKNLFNTTIKCSITLGLYLFFFTALPSQAKLLAKYNFEEPSWDGTPGEVIDSSGNGNHGTSISGATTKVTSNPAGPSNNFRDGYFYNTPVLIGNPAEWQFTGEITLAAWIKPERKSDHSNIISHGYENLPTKASVTLRLLKDETYQVGSWDGSNHFAESPIPSGDFGTWVHIAGVYDGTQWKLYRNGVIVDTLVTTVGAIPVTNGNWAIGGRLDAAMNIARGFIGSIDETAIFDHALTTNEIKNLMTTGKTSKVIGQWSFDNSWDSGENAVIDSSGNGLHGDPLLSTTGGGLENPAIVTDSFSGTCGYMKPPPLSGGAILEDLSMPSEDGDKVTVSFWMNWQGNVAQMLVGFLKYDLFLNQGAIGFNTANGNDLYGVSLAGYDFGWHHISAEFTSGDVTSNQLFIDGVRQTLTQIRSVPSAANAVFTNKLKVAGWLNGASHTFQNEMDELYIHSGILTTTEVIELMNATHNCPGLVLDYTFDDEKVWNGTADEVVDYSNSGLHATTGGVFPKVTEDARVCRAAEVNSNNWIKLEGDPKMDITANNADFSVAFWFRLDETVSVQFASIFHRGETSLKRFPAALLRKDGRIHYRLSTTSSSNEGGDSVARLTVGEWYHIALIKKDDQYSMYLNGVLDSSVTLSGETVSAPNEPLYIGDTPWSLGVSATIDEFQLYSIALNEKQVESLYEEERFCVAPVAVYHFDEPTLSGTAGEVIDSSGNDLHGYGAKTGSDHKSGPNQTVPSTLPGQVCDSHGFAMNTAVIVDDDPLLHLGKNNKDYSIAFWMRIENDRGFSVMSLMHHGNVEAEAGPALWVKKNEQLLVKQSTTTSTSQLSSTAAIPLATWTHVTLVKKLDQLSIYLNGVLDNSITLPEDTVSFSAPFYMGDSPWKWGADTRLDEVYLFDVALLPADMQILIEDTRDCVEYPTLAYFKVEHGNTGIFCAPQAITVTAFDGTGEVLESFAGSVKLSTGDPALSNKGDWSLALQGGSVISDGFLDNGVAGDGVAEYSFVASDLGIAKFNLDYPSGAASINIATVSDTVTDDDLEGDLTFSPTGFRISNNILQTGVDAAVTPDPLANQIAGETFDIYITAYGESSTNAGVCGVIEEYQGKKSISFASQYINPTTSSTLFAIAGLNLPTDGSPITQNTVNFSQGYVKVRANYKDAGKMLFTIQEVGGAGLQGSSNEFVVRPDRFVFNAISGNPGASTATGTIFKSAGESFNVEVKAVSKTGAITPNYGNESVAESTKLEYSLIAPAGGSSGILTVDGEALSDLNRDKRHMEGSYKTEMSWNEVGAIRLNASNSDYLGAGAITSASIDVGRFKPDHLEVTAKTDGSFDSVCSAGFNYLGKSFSFSAFGKPTFRVQAKNKAGDLTSNYTGDFFKLGLASITIDQVTADESAPSHSLTHTQAVATLAESGTSGEALYTFGSDTFVYDRSVPMTVFNSDIKLKISNLNDMDNVAAVLPVGGEIINTIGTDMRYGRLSIGSAIGSELVDMMLPIKLEYYDNSAFVTNEDDNCSTFSVGALQNHGGDIQNDTSASISALVNGEAALTLTAPGAGKLGSVLVPLIAVDNWLKFDWDNDPLTVENGPQGLATFGLFEGNDVIIYRREIRN